MELLFLGTGTTAINKERFPSSYVLKVEGTVVLIDMGPGTLLRLQKHDINPKSLNVILLTHSHEDHLADLWPFLFTKVYDPHDNDVMTTILAHPDLLNSISYMKKNQKPWLSKLKNVTFIPISGENQVQLHPVNITAFNMNHQPESLGFLVDGDTAKVGFTGDTDLCPGLVDLYNKSDYLIMECSFPSAKAIEGHLTPGKIEQLFASARSSVSKPGKIFLSHVYPYEELEKEMHTLCDKNKSIVIAYDDLNITL